MSQESYTRDDIYFCEDLVLLVENTLFKVPRRVFESSEFFRDMFSLPVPEGQVVDGMTEKQPLRLHSTYTTVDFRRFLKVIVPFEYIENRAYTEEEWASVLKLATMWGFSSLRAAAIAGLSSLKPDPVLKIMLSKQHGVDQWLVPGLNELAQREAPLSIAEAERLYPIVGWEFVLKIGHVREKAFSATANQCLFNNYCQSCRTYSAHCRTCSGTNQQVAVTTSARASYDFTAAIREVFGLSG